MNRKFLIITIALILISRVFLSIAVSGLREANLSGGPHFYGFAQDEGLYNLKALMEAFRLKGMPSDPELYARYFPRAYRYDITQRESYGCNAYTGTLARFYYIFGFRPQTARLINIFFNIMAFLLVFYLAKEIFSAKAAKIAAAVFAFFPSVVLWSVSFGVDMLVISGLLAFFFFLLRAFKGRSWVWFFAGVFFLIPVWTVRKFVVFLALIAALPVLAAMTPPALRKRLIAVLFLIIAVTGTFLFFSGSRTAEIFLKEKTSEMIQEQKAASLDDESGYLIFPEHCYTGVACGPGDVLKAYLKGMGYAVLSPFPWRIESKSQLAAYPQMILWYLMLPFTIYGFYAGFKKNPRAATALFLFSFSVFSVMALLEGNIGSVFRHRDMVTPFLLIFFGGAFEKVI